MTGNHACQCEKILLIYAAPDFRLGVALHC
jgi:hypothetical protein